MKIAHSERLLKAARDVVFEYRDRVGLEGHVDSEDAVIDELEAIVREIDRELKGDKL